MLIKIIREFQRIRFQDDVHVFGKRQSKKRIANISADEPKSSLPGRAPGCACEDLDSRHFRDCARLPAASAMISA